MRKLRGFLLRVIKELLSELLLEPLIEKALEAVLSMLLAGLFPILSNLTLFQKTWIGITSAFVIFILILGIRRFFRIRDWKRNEHIRKKVLEKKVKNTLLITKTLLKISAIEEKAIKDLPKIKLTKQDEIRIAKKIKSNLHLNLLGGTDEKSIITWVNKSIKQHDLQDNELPNDNMVNFMMVIARILNKEVNGIYKHLSDYPDYDIEEAKLREQSINLSVTTGVIINKYRDYSRGVNSLPVLLDMFPVAKNFLPDKLYFDTDDYIYSKNKRLTNYLQAIEQKIIEELYSK